MSLPAGFKSRTTPARAGSYSGGSATPNAANRFKGVVDGTAGGSMSSSATKKLKKKAKKSLKQREADVAQGTTKFRGEAYGLDATYTPFGREPGGQLYAPYGVGSDGKALGANKKRLKMLRRKFDDSAGGKKKKKKSKKEKRFDAGKALLDAGRKANGQKRSKKEKNHDRKVKLALRRADEAAKKLSRKASVATKQAPGKKKKGGEAAAAPGGGGGGARRCEKRLAKKGPKKKKTDGQLQNAKDKKVMKMKRKLKNEFRAGGMTKNAAQDAVKNLLGQNRKRRKKDGSL